MIRRIKSEVLTLPPKKRDQIFVNISEEDRKKFAERLGKIDASSLQLDIEFFVSEEDTTMEKKKEADFERRKARRRLYTQLWQETGEAKITGLLSYVSHHLESPEAAGGRTKFLVFAYHTNVLESVSKLLTLLVRTRCNYSR